LTILKILLTVSLFTLRRGGGLCVTALPSRIPLADACCLTSKSTQVVKLRSSDTASFDEVNVIDDSRVEWKNSFDAHSKTCFPYGNGLARASMLPGDYNALESLKSLLGFGFLDTHVDTDRIAWLKLRNIVT
jgi:hypothetical protein